MLFNWGIIVAPQVAVAIAGFGSAAFAQNNFAALQLFIL